MEHHGDKYHAGPLYHRYFWIIMHDQQYLNDYFSNHWKPSQDAYTYSVYEVIAKKIQPYECLLDFGVDPAMDEADFQFTK